MSTEEFGDLDEAIDAMRARAAGAMRGGPLGPAQGFREYESGERVAARLSLSTGGRLTGRQAGIDVMGDGAIVPYSGLLNKRRLEGRSPDRAIEAVREALSERR